MTSVNGPTVLADTPSKTNKAAAIWHGGDSAQWHKRELMLKDASVQSLELAAICSAFQLFSQEPLNITTDSAYAAKVGFCLESSYLKHVNNYMHVLN